MQIPDSRVGDAGEDGQNPGEIPSSPLKDGGEGSKRENLRGAREARPAGASAGRPPSQADCSLTGPRLGEAVQDVPPGDVVAEELERVEALAREDQPRTLAPTRPVVGRGFEFTEFDFSRDPEPPDYLIKGLIERGSVTMVSGDTGTGKSMVIKDLVVAALTGRDWLGRAVRAQRPLVIDEENPGCIVHRRLQALGLTNEHTARLRYANRQGIRIGEPESTAWLRAMAGEFAADLIIIDTAAAATAAEINDNDSVARLYTEALRPLASALNAAVIVLHHERKIQANQSRDRGQMTMGARQWIAQADAHIALAKARADNDKPTLPDHQVTRVEMSFPKLRDGSDQPPRMIAITSKRNPDGSLAWLKVHDEGDVEPKLNKVEELVQRIQDALEDHDGELTTKELLERTSAQRGSLWDRALTKAVSQGRVKKIAHGRYAPAAVKP